MSAFIEHPPLANVVQGLGSDELSPEEISVELVNRGYHVADFVAQIEKTVRSLSAESRLGWMSVGAANQAKLDHVLREARSWRTRTMEEINEAFERLLQASRGSETELRLQTAFKNLTELTTESKAAFLDEIEALKKLEDHQK